MTTAIPALAMGHLDGISENLASENDNEAEIAHHFKMYGINQVNLAIERQRLIDLIANNQRIAIEKQKNKANKPKTVSPKISVGLATAALITPATARVKPPRNKKPRDPTAIYEVYADQKLLEQKVESDVRKHNHEKKTHENIIKHEHDAHVVRVNQLKLNEMKHINDVYNKALEEIKKLPVKQRNSYIKNVNDEKQAHENKVFEQSHHLTSKFDAMENFHEKIFTKIEKCNDKSRQTENKITKGYNNHKATNYAERFLFGVALENPQTVMDSADLTLEAGSYLKRKDYTHPLLQSYPHRNPGA